MATGSSGPAWQGDWLALPCACANLRRLARLASRIYDEELRPADMEVAQFGLTATISRIGPVTQAQLARGLAMDQTSLARTLAGLEQRGWIEKRRGADRRTRLFAATTAGIAQVDRARPFWRRAQQRLARALGAERLDALDRSVGHAAALLRQEAAPPPGRPARRASRTEARHTGKGRTPSTRAVTQA
jgi:DNA-binding MarR family transcriptional regulator